MVFPPLFDFKTREKALIILHISSVHSSSDPRIRLKEIKSLSDRYGHIFFVTGDLDASNKFSEDDRVKIVKVWPGRKNKFRRFLFTSPLCIFRALKLRPDICHLHDPELLIWAWIFKMFGVDVVYDIHEDYVSAVSQKNYIPRFFRSFAGKMVGSIENFLSSNYYRVIAEKYYSRRFPDAEPILNYPILENLLTVCAYSQNASSALYAGNVTPDRGGLAMAEFNAYSSKFDIKAVGRCAPGFYDHLRLYADERNSKPIEVKGIGYFVEFSDIIVEYAKGAWLAGVALFPDTGHYREKELTKFFEYMAVGLPIIASDFPVWKKLIEDQGVGICVPPGDNEAIESALDWLRSHPEKAEEMSRRGKELARRKYSWESQAHRLIDLYERIRAEREAG
jgi:glycosyltransferase involved in cell wall biosynthesis